MRTLRLIYTTGKFYVKNCRYVVKTAAPMKSYFLKLIISLGDYVTAWTNIIHPNEVCWFRSNWSVVEALGCLSSNICILLYVSRSLL